MMKKQTKIKTEQFGLLEQVEAGSGYQVPFCGDRKTLALHQPGMGSLGWAMSCLASIPIMVLIMGCSQQPSPTQSDLQQGKVVEKLERIDEVLQQIADKGLAPAVETVPAPTGSQPASNSISNQQKEIVEQLGRIEEVLNQPLAAKPVVVAPSVPAKPTVQSADNEEKIIERLNRAEAAMQQLVLADRLERIDQALRQSLNPPQATAPALPGPTPAASAPVVAAQPATTPAVAPAVASQPSPAAPVAPAVGSNGYKVVPVANGGIITGKIQFSGKARPPKTFKVEKTPEVCGKEDRLLHEVAIKEGKLQDVVLVLEGVKAGKPYDSHVILGPPPGEREGVPSGIADFPGTDIKPLKCIFGAFTGVIADNSVLRFDNQDSVKHSPHTYEIKGRVRKSLHNQDLEGNGQLELPIKFKKGKVIKLECDQHPHMQNWFYRVDNPYYAFSSEDGTFKIDQIPPGKYKLIAWHPILGEQSHEVSIEANGTVDLALEFSSRKRRG
jgi:hypothetical protein